jgi:hypothetical protein
VIAILLLVLAQTPQEDEAKRARDAVFGLPGMEQKAPSAPAPAPDPAQDAPPSSFMTPRARKSIDDYKSLLDQNVFSPPRKKDPPKSEKTQEGPKVETPKTHSWTLTGIMFNGVEKRYEALIENTSTKEAKFLKEGDTVAGAQITSVTFDQVAYKKGETTGVLKLKEALTEVVAGGSGGVSAPLKPEEQAEVDKTRERLKKRNRRERVEDEAEEDGESRKKPK